MKNVHRRRHASASGLKKVLKIVVFIGLIIPLASFGRYFLQTYFRVQTVVCTVDQSSDPCPTEVEAELQNLMNKPLWTINPTALQRKIKSGWIRTQSVAIQTKFPHTVLVKLRMYKDAVALRSAAKNELLWVNEQGLIVRTEQDASNSAILAIDYELPTQNLEVGGQLPEEYVTGLRKTIDAIQATSIRPKTLVYQSANLLTLHLESEQLVYINPLADPQAQVSTLQQVLREATMDKKAKSIDVRFTHPVLQY